MKIQCPECSSSMRVKEPRAGSYKPTCKNCKQRFRLEVDSEGNGAVTKLAPASQSTNTPNAPKETTTAAATNTAATSAGAEPNTPAGQTGAPASLTAATASGPEAVGGSPGLAETIFPPAETPPDETLPQETLPETPADNTLNATPGEAVDEAVSATSAAMDGTLAIDPMEATQDDTSAPSNHGGQPQSPASSGQRVSATNAIPEATMAHDSAVANERPADMPEQLGGYRVLRELGRGAMGAVYVARQVALSRDVALKTIQSRWAESPKMLARFMREAFAAAQLSHHNMIQIYDLGSDHNVNFFSMELVPGCNLAELVEQRGRLPAAEAVGLIVQAARGLQAAHNQGLVHRDVKPANLMLSDLGVVKVADLGLVKIANRLEIEDSSPSDDGGLPDDARGDLTMAHNAMGTAAFMAPEQGDDASTADHRADIYSLGCTLYVLLTGKPPFDGATAMELITKHKTNPIVRPDAIVDDIPGTLSDIVVRMVAKEPAERYSNMGEVIDDLEKFRAQHKQADGAESPVDVSQVTQFAARHASLPAVKRQRAVTFAVAGGGGLLAVVLLLINPTFGLGILGALVTGAIARELVRNRGFGDGVLGKLREWIGNAKLSDYLTWFAAGVLLLSGVWALELLGASLMAVALGVAGGAVLALVVDRAAVGQQESVVAEARQALQQLRMQGEDEAAIRKSISKVAHRNFVEALFGYSAMREVMPKRRLSLRDAAYDLMDGKIEEVRREKQQEQVQQAEQKRLQSEGLSADEARQQAEHIAASLAEEVRQLRREAATQRSAAVDPAEVARKKRERMKQLLAEGQDLSSGQVRMRRLGRMVLNPFLGAQARFLMGAALLAGCLLWIQQNEMVDDLRTVSGLKSALLEPGENSTPLKLPIVGPWVNTLHVGIAGLLLIFSAQYGGWRNAITTLPAAFLIGAAANFGLPGLGLPGGAWTLGVVSGVTLFIAGVYLFGADD